MNKEELFIDFDDTTVKSNKRFCELYNLDYHNHPEFKEANGELEYKWNFATQCPLIQQSDIQKYFNDERFFEGLEFYEGAKEAIKRLSGKYIIKIPSMGWTNNLRLKEEFINKHLDNHVEFIPIDFDCASDKSTIDMSNGIHIDDNSRYLFSSNAKLKIAFGRVAEWNNNWNGIRLYDWKTLEQYLNKRKMKGF